ncbi:hypothetical protein FS837_009248 [Tulasnella sp. UAMH 9824]|nr:hypothetical protein FS837_009248 [Tulasnella sp. UAMH 9824]
MAPSQSEFPGEKEFIKTTVSTYLGLCTNHSISETILDDKYLTSEPAKDNLIGTLERIQDIITREVTKLKRRRNNEHSLIYQLPPEVFVEILLLAIDWSWWDTEKLRALAKVSTYWRDTILSCHRFWPVIDVMANGQARKMTMKRNTGGPVDVWCWSGPDSTAMQEFMQDVRTVPETRWRSILYDYRPETEVFMDYLQTQTSSLVDVLLFNANAPDESTVSLDLSPEGPHLRHVDVRGIGIPWQSPRLTNLVTLSLRNIYRDIPQPAQLYAVLSSSPRLERLCILDVKPGPSDPITGSLPTTSPPITLPVLAGLAFKKVSTSITRNILPLIRAPACKTVVVTEPQDTTPELLARPIAVSESLKIKLELEGKSCVHVRSEPDISFMWAYWAHDKPGIDVRLAVHSADGLNRMWNQLDTIFRSRGEATNIKTLEIEWSMDVSGEELPSTFGLFRFCPNLTELCWVDHTGTTLRTLVRLLQRREGNEENIGSGTSTWLLPGLNHLRYYANTMMDMEECAADLKTFLELRYPCHAENSSSIQFVEDPTPIKQLDLPSQLVAKLKSMDVATFLKLEDVAQSSG